MHNIFCIHIGQCGIQLGFALWELFISEHGIARDGHMSVSDLNGTTESFFNNSVSGHFVPRGIFVDLEPTVIDQMRTGAFRNLYHPDQLINGCEDAANNFARGFHTVGRVMKRTCENRIRKEFELNDHVHALHIFRSLGGGTGSGMTATMFEILQDYAKMSKIEIPIHPSPHLSCAIVEPYNCILSEHFCMEDIDISTLIDNEALYDIMISHMDIRDPNLHCINRLIAQVISALTSSIRFDTELHNDIISLTNLVPYPRIHFPLISYAPFASEAKLSRSSNTIIELTKACFDTENQLVKCDPVNGKYMSCSLLYRGGNISPTEIFNALAEIKSSRSIRFVDWCPTGFKVGVVKQPPLIIPDSKMGVTYRDVVMMTNTSSVSALWHRLAQKFHKLYAKRSFVHWFVAEGLEESEFCESLYNMATLAKDYEEVALDTKLDETMGDAGEGGVSPEGGGATVAPGGEGGGGGGEGGDSKAGEGGDAGEGGGDEDDEDTDDDEEINDNVSNAVKIVRKIMNNHSKQNEIDWKKQFEFLMTSICKSKEFKDANGSSWFIKDNSKSCGECNNHCQKVTISQADSKQCNSYQSCTYNNTTSTLDILENDNNNMQMINSKENVCKKMDNDYILNKALVDYKNISSEQSLNSFISQPSMRAESDCVSSNHLLDDDEINDDIDSLEEYATQSLMEDLVRKTSHSNSIDHLIL